MDTELHFCKLFHFRSPDLYSRMMGKVADAVEGVMKEDRDPHALNAHLEVGLSQSLILMPSTHTSRYVYHSL